MSTLNSRLQLSILNRKKGKNLAERGFTLIELLVTVVILGTLSAIAVPGFLDYQKEGVAAANNAEAMALAKACTAGMATPGAVLTAPCTTSGGTFPMDKVPAKATPASVTVNANGDITVASKSVKK